MPPAIVRGAGEPAALLIGGAALGSRMGAYTSEKKEDCRENKCFVFVH